MSQHGYQPSFRKQIRSDKTMDLFIETLTGTAFEMTVSPFDTVMSIKSKIQRVEGIPVSHQHLLYNTLELEDASCLTDYSIRDGATLKLVLSMRGGPISTRRLPVGKEIAWKEHLRELVEGRQDQAGDKLPHGARVTVFVFGEGSQMNLVRVIENDDGSYTPLSEAWSGSSIRNLFAEENPEQSNRKLQENSITMGKMQDLQHKMETLTMLRKPKNDSPAPARGPLGRRLSRAANAVPIERLELRSEPRLAGCAATPPAGPKADSLSADRRRAGKGAADALAGREPRFGRRAPTQPQDTYRPTMSDQAASPDASKTPARPRCFHCRRRLNITNAHSCRCGQLFCAEHRHCEAHRCTFDYKGHGRRQIQEANPLVSAPKLPEI